MGVYYLCSGTDWRGRETRLVELYKRPSLPSLRLFQLRIMNRRDKLGLVTFIFLFAVLLCFYFGIQTRIVDKFRDKFNMTDCELLPPPPPPPPPPLAPQRQGPIMEHKIPQKLPQSVIDGVKTFVFFVGHPCSGHSIVGSLLDSHPHMVISNEYTVFWKLSKGALAPTKPEIFNALWRATQVTVAKHGFRTLNQKGYTLFVDGLYEGKYIDYINVIGDKRGDRAIEMFMDHPRNWSSVYSILQSLNVTLKVIHVIRNPYDNIATLIFFVKTSQTLTFGSVKQSNKTHSFSSKHILKWIRFYFQHHEAIVKAKEKYNLDIIEVHGKDLISDSKSTLLKLCDQLGVTCSDNYLEMCSKKIFKTESKTRYLVKWTDEQLELIQQNIKKYSCLKGYTFNSM